MAGSAVILPYLMPMLLGRTINLAGYNIGADIYDELGSVETSVQNLNATYHVLKGDCFPYEYFGMPIDVALRIKAGNLATKSGALGLDGLLKDTARMHNSAVIATMAIYSKVQRTLPTNVTLLSSWKQRISHKNTHYAASMVHGGWFAVLYRFRCNIASDVPSVYETVVKTLGKSGKISKNIEELWYKVKTAVEENKKVRGEVIVEHRIYSSVKLPIEIEKPSDLSKAVDLLPSSIDGIGIPIFMTLKPLSDIDSGFPTVTKNSASAKDFQKLDKMWDDVQHTRSHVMRWLKESTTIFEDEEEDRIYNFLEKLNECVRLFKLLIPDISIYKEVDQVSLQQAFSAYEKGLERGSDSYDLMYLRLKEEIDVSCESKFLRGIKGSLDVFDNEQHFVGEVGAGGIEDCKIECLKHGRCRSIGYADSVNTLDEKTGNYVTKKNQCWVYYRSSSTAPVMTKNGLYGDLRIYDRECL